MWLLSWKFRVQEEETFILLSLLLVGVEGGDSEVDSKSEQSSCSGKGKDVSSVSLMLGSHCIACSLTFSHIYLSVSLYKLSRSPNGSREGNLEAERSERDAIGAFVFKYFKYFGG